MLGNVVSAESWGIQQDLLGHERAGMLLTDFAAAFPSILVGFMLAVLQSMGVPSFVLGFYTLLYRDNYGIITLGGKRFDGFQILRGTPSCDGCEHARALIFVGLLHMLTTAYLRCTTS
eukprot:2172713-Pyramimonas_sp.AAC.1